MLLLDVLERLMPSALTDPCELHCQVGRLALANQRTSRLYRCIYKAVLGLLRSCTCSLLAVKHAARVSLSVYLFMHKLNLVKEFLSVWLQND